MASPASSPSIEADDGIVTVHDLTTGAELGSYEPDRWRFPLNFAMAPDGRRLVVATAGGQLAVRGSRRARPTPMTQPTRSPGR